MAMAVSRLGALTLAVLTLALVLNVLVYRLPRWSVNVHVNKLYKKTMYDLPHNEFAAGLFGFCVASRPNCALFHARYHVPGHGQVDSVCSMYTSGPHAWHQRYVRAAALAARMDVAQFDQFLKKSCGSIGTWSIVSGALSICCGFTSVGLLGFCIGWPRANSYRQVCGRAGKGFALVACGFSLVMWLLWLVQSTPLKRHDGTTLAIGFALAVVVTALYAMGVVLATRREQEEVDATGIESLTLTPPMPTCSRV